MTYLSSFLGRIGSFFNSEEVFTLQSETVSLAEPKNPNTESNKYDNYIKRIKESSTEEETVNIYFEAFNKFFMPLYNEESNDLHEFIDEIKNKNPLLKYNASIKNNLSSLKNPSVFFPYMTNLLVKNSSDEKQDISGIEFKYNKIIRNKIDYFINQGKIFKERQTVCKGSHYTYVAGHNIQ